MRASWPPTLLAFLLALFFTACDSFSPSDEPLPSFDALREVYGAEAPGSGYVKEGERVSRSGGTQTAASSLVFNYGHEELTTILVELHPEGTEVNTGASIAGIDIRGTPLDELQAGMEFGAWVSYDGLGGSGRLEIVSVTDDHIAGVFAADVQNRPATFFELPIYRRVHGGFNAQFVPQPE